MTRRLAARVRLLETALRARVSVADLEAEAAAYGELLWGEPLGRRCYARDTPDGFEMTVLDHGQAATVYQIAGVDWREFLDGVDGRELQ